MDPLNEKKNWQGFPYCSIIWRWRLTAWNGVPFSSWSTIRTPALSYLKRMKQNKLVFILRTIQALDWSVHLFKKCWLFFRLSFVIIRSFRVFSVTFFVSFISSSLPQGRFQHRISQYVWLNNVDSSSISSSISTFSSMSSLSSSLSLSYSCCASMF